MVFPFCLPVRLYSLDKRDIVIQSGDLAAFKVFGFRHIHTRFHCHVVLTLQPLPNPFTTSTTSGKSISSFLSVSSVGTPSIVQPRRS